MLIRCGDGGRDGLVVGVGWERVGVSETGIYGIYPHLTKRRLRGSTNEYLLFLWTSSVSFFVLRSDTQRKEATLSAWSTDHVYETKRGRSFSAVVFAGTGSDPLVGYPISLHSVAYIKGALKGELALQRAWS